MAKFAPYFQIAFDRAHGTRRTPGRDGKMVRDFLRKLNENDSSIASAFLAGLDNLNWNRFSRHILQNAPLIKNSCHNMVVSIHALPEPRQEFVESKTFSTLAAAPFTAQSETKSQIASSALYHKAKH